jgi:hypothetical protein
VAREATGRGARSQPGAGRRFVQRTGELRRKYRWIATAVVAVAAFVLGFIGWSAKPGGPSSVVDRLYATVVLFRFNTVLSNPPYPAPLEVARWLAPLTLAYAFFSAVGSVFSEQWTRFRVRLFARDHVIVCGLGLCGSRLADSFRDQGETVVAIDRDPSEADLANCRKQGIRVLRGDASDRELLALARLDRARRLVAVCGDDGINSEVALVVQAEVAGRRRPLSCFVLITDEPLCRLLQEAALGDPAHDLVRLEYFNVYRSGPHALVSAYSEAFRERDGDPPQLVVAGGGQIGPNVIAEACRRWALERRDPSRRLRATLISPRAEDECRRLRERYPDLVGICDLAAMQAQPSDADDAPIDSPVDPSAQAGSAIAFVYEDDDRACLRATIRVRKALPDSVPVVACTSGRSGVAMLLSRTNSGANAHVEGFELLDRVCRSEVILNGDLELIARAVHDNYVAHEVRTNPDAGLLPAVVDWELLPEAYRESNRDQADDIGRKLSAIGYVLAPAPDLQPDVVCFTEQEIDTLARMEHDRWMSERMKYGWTYGSPRDNKRKLHPDLRPWSELADEVQDKDRDAVQNIPMVLVRAGFVVTRRHGVAAVAGASGAT